MLKIVLLQILALTICSNVAVGDQSSAEKKVSVFTNFSESDLAAQNLVKAFTEVLENDKPKGASLGMNISGHPEVSIAQGFTPKVSYQANLT
jgi:hypothetical protein